MTRQEILQNYKVSSYGTIQSPGKFEGEAIYMPAIYDIYLDGCSDDHLVDDILYSFVNVDDDLIKEFPELEDREERMVAFYERDDGFVCEVTPFDPNKDQEDSEDTDYFYLDE